VTPDQYPLTLNALTNACNQKSSRDPVMSPTQEDVQHAVRELTGKRLAWTDEDFKSTVDPFIYRTSPRRSVRPTVDPLLH
jgi:uncharacterized protein